MDRSNRISAPAPVRTDRAPTRQIAIERSEPAAVISTDSSVTQITKEIAVKSRD